MMRDAVGLPHAARRQPGENAAPVGSAEPEFRGGRVLPGIFGDAERGGGHDGGGMKQWPVQWADQ